ncbi:MAG TPA: hypothetical protein VFQ86_04200, partial [Arachidicoccus soli]|nr:hypothetical protein [Arachidicoccus soli]
NKIINMQVTGNLPDSLVYTLKKRILETEGHWSFSSEKDINKPSKWFVFPVFVDRQIGNCKVNNSVTDSYSWLDQLFDKQNRIIYTPTSYLLYPLYIWGVN